MGYLQTFAYYNLMTAAIFETAITAIVLTNLVFGKAGEKMPRRARMLFKISQTGFTAAGLFIIFELTVQWPAYYSILISAPFWFHFMSQVAVLDFHKTRKLWQ